MENALILRYTDFQSIFTILEHQAILKEKKRVLWGWWKKPHENLTFNQEKKKWNYYNDLDAGDSVGVELPSKVYLCDFNNRKVYLAEYVEIISTFELDDAQREWIPPYYRASDQVAFYFVFSNITEKKYVDFVSEYQDHVDFSSINTMLFALQGVTVAKNSCDTIKLKSCNILHISDLHFGTKSAYKQGCTDENLRNVDSGNDLLKKLPLPEKNIGLIIASGDFVVAKEHRSNPKNIEKAFRLANEFLLELCKKYELDPKLHLILAIGNHDNQLELVANTQGDELEFDLLKSKSQNACKAAYVSFQSNLIGATQLHYVKKYSLTGGYKMNFIVLDSCDYHSEQIKDYGYIADRQLSSAAFKEFESKKRKTINIAICHHPIVPPPIAPRVNSHQDKAGKYHCDPLSVISNSFAVANWLTNKHIPLVLHGHQHYPYFGSLSMHNPVESEHALKKANISYFAAGSLALPASTGGLYDEFPVQSFNTYEINSAQKTLTAHVYEFTPNHRPATCIDSYVLKL